MATGSGFIFLNERIMNAIGYPYPMMLSFLGFFGSTIIATFLVWSGIVATNPKNLIMVGSIGVKVCCLSLLIATSVVTGMAAYLYLSISFIQMLKATTPVMTMAILLCLNMLDFRYNLVLSTIVIVIGAIISGFGEGGLSSAGLAIMLISCLSEATRCVLTQNLLDGTKLSVIEGLYLMSPPCALATFLAVFFFEKNALSAKGFDSMYANPAIFTLASTLGFVQHLCTLWVVQSTNALTLKILGPLRSVVVVGVSVLCLGESLSLLKGSGYVISLFGLLWYNVSQMAINKTKIFNINANPGSTAGEAPGTGNNGYVAIGGKRRTNNNTEGIVLDDINIHHIRTSKQNGGGSASG
mmetsp:Transcript_31008/g.54419  ORF Transcript_31008/g.54419 Transcript_31008/m.54419 type:complete len:354 (+) Transcript_31008:90-1151(+)